MNTFNPSDLATLSTCRALAADLFGGEEWTREGGEAKVYDKGRESVTSWAIGNCHVRCDAEVQLRASPHSHRTRR